MEHGHEVVPVINGMIPRFNRVVATQDWHPVGHVSFASIHAGRKVYDTVKARGIPQVLWPDHCVQGTRGAELHSDLDVRGIGLVLRKGMRAELDSYSAFFENDKATSTGLGPYLSGIGVTDVYLCGLATDYCVFHSAMDALELGYGVTLIRDACRGVDVPPGRVEETLREMAAAGVHIAESAALP